MNDIREQIVKMAALADELDEAGKFEESAVLTAMLAKYADDDDAESGSGMKKGCEKACNTFKNQLEAFCGKCDRLDFRGAKRRKLEAISSKANELLDMMKEVME